MDAERARLVEFATFLEAMQGAVMDDADLTRLDELHAAYNDLVEADSSRRLVRRLGTAWATEWRERWEFDLALEEARQDLERSGAAEMSEVELIRAAEAAKQAYRRAKGEGAMAGRITYEPGFLDLVDVLGRGGTADWQDLYARARTDAALRAEIRQALKQVDPDLGSAPELWETLLNGLDSAAES